jgi:regulatory protein
VRRSGSAGAAGPLPAEPSELDDRRADPEPDPEDVARTICLRLLTVRARSRAELRDALAARAVPELAATKVLDRLAEVGLVDDQAYADGYVSSRQRDRGLSVREIGRQLRDKGVDEAVIATAVDTVTAEAEAEVARQLVLRKLRSMTRLAPEVKTRRLVGMLARKGYSPGMAFRVVRDAVAECGEETGVDDTAWLA